MMGVNQFEFQKEEAREKILRDTNELALLRLTRKPS
jgi:hypothetical protein